MTPTDGKAEENLPRDGLRRLHGRRQAHKLKPRQARLMEELLPSVSVDIGERDPLDPALLFGHPGEDRPLWLEVGYGGGEHLAWQAERHPETDFLGAEPFLNGIAKMLTEIEERSLRNVRLYTRDARDLLEALPEARVDRAFVLHPDPWPKRRHWKRRFIQTETLDQFTRILKPGAELRVASDIASYVWWTLAHAMPHPAFEWTAEGPTDWRTPPDDWPRTRYEAKARREGRVPSYLRLRRR